MAKSKKNSKENTYAHFLKIFMDGTLYTIPGREGKWRLASVASGEKYITFKLERIK